MLTQAPEWLRLRRSSLARLLSLLVFATLLPIVPASFMSAAHAVGTSFNCPGGGVYTVTDGTLGSDWNRICSGEVTLDNSVTRLDYVGFYSNASAITIPATTLNISYEPFYGPNLETITVAASNPNYKSVDVVLYSKDGNTLISYPINKAGENFTVPSGVLEVAYYAFGCLKNLKHLILPDSLVNATSIGQMNGCGDNSLESYEVSGGNSTFSTVGGVLFNKTQTVQMEYPRNKAGTNYDMLNTVTEIQSQAFSNSRYLQTITLSDHLEHIGTYSFMSLNLATLHLPASLTTVDPLGLDSVQSVTLDSQNTHLTIFQGVLFNADKSRLLVYFNDDARSSYTFPSSVTSIQHHIFGNNSGRSLKRLSIGTSLAVSGVTQAPITYLNLGSNFQSRNTFDYWYFNSLKTVNYCGNDGQTISEINAHLSGWNNATLVCVTNSPAFSLSQNSEAASVGSAIQGYSISSSTPADSYAISPNPGSYGLTFNSTTGLLSGTPNQVMSQVQFTITGSNSLGESTATYTLSVRSPPSAPTSVVAKATGYNSASVSFTPSTSDGYSLISEYIAVSTPGNISASISASEVGPIAVSGLTPGTSYTFKVKARNSVGLTESAASTAISTNAYGVYHVGDIGPSGGYIFFVTDTPFACASGSCNYVEAAPVDLTPGTWESATATALAYRGGGRADWYLPSTEMQQYMYDNLAYVGLGSFPCANTYGDGCRGVEYWSSTESGTAQAYFKRFGVSGGWWYSSADAKSVVREVRPVRAVATPTVAGPPTIGAVSRVGVLSANVAFTPPSSDGGRTITSYRVTSSPGGITATSSSTINNVIRIDGLSPSTAYRFTVRAINEAGESTSSAQSSAYTTPSVPAISAPIRGAGSVLINVTGWSSAFDVAVTLGSNSPGRISVDTSTASTYAVTISDLFADEVVTPSFVVSAAGTNEIVRSAKFTTSAAAGALSLSKTLSVPSPDLQNGLIALSSDGTFMLVADSAQAGLIYLSTNGGKSWSPQYSMGRAAWGRPTMSSTGQYMAVSATGTKIWVSNNYGATWAERDEARSWKSVSISADGHTILATTDGLNNIFSSTNYGGTWETMTATASNWRYAVPSGDGSKIAVCMNSDGLYLSTNGGASATRMKSFAAYSVNENSCAGVGMSSNGTTIVLLLGSYGHMLISTNSGSTWTEVTRFAGIGLSNLSVSSDGTRISAVDASSGNLYVSTDSGRSWQKITERVINSSAFTSAGTLVALPKSVNILQGKSLTGVCTNDTTSLSTSNRINDGDSSSLFRCYTNSAHSTARYVPQSAGFVTPDVGSWIVTGISFVPGTSSNLDPTKFSLFGCTTTSSSSCKILVANGSTGLGTNTTLVKIRNSESYNFYRVLFESIRGANIPNYGNALELAEVSLFGAPAPISSSESLGSGSSSSGSITQLGIIPLVGPIASNTNGYAFSILNFDRSYSWNVVPTGGESVTLNTSTGLVTVTGLASQNLGTVMITASKQGYISSDPLFVSGTAIAAIETTVVQGSQSLVTIALSPAGSASSFDVSVGLPYSTPAGAKILAEGAMTDRVDRGLGTVRLSLRDSNNAPIETLADAVSITIPTSQGAVPVYSPTGTSWVAIPELIPAYVGAVALLPAGQMMGYYINANGDTVILTRKI